MGRIEPGVEKSVVLAPYVLQPTVHNVTSLTHPKRPPVIADSLAATECQPGHPSNGVPKRHCPAGASDGIQYPHGSTSKAPISCRPWQNALTSLTAPSTNR